MERERKFLESSKALKFTTPKEIESDKKAVRIYHKIHYFIILLTSQNL